VSGVHREANYGILKDYAERAGAIVSIEKIQGYQPPVVIESRQNLIFTPAEVARIEKEARAFGARRVFAWEQKEGIVRISDRNGPLFTLNR
jgi:hypothetical protein